jgi:hypothetical protein
MTNEDNNEVPGPVSRRDFLRRAGKEAVTTGTNLVPGAKLATTAISVAQGKNGLWQKLAKWRDAHKSETTQSSENRSETSNE